MDKKKREEDVIAFRDMLKELTQKQNLKKGTCDIIVLNYRKFGLTSDAFMKMIEKRFLKAIKRNSRTEIITRGLSLVVCSWIANCIRTDFLKGEEESKELYASLLQLLERIAEYYPIEANKIKLALIRYNPNTLKRERGPRKRGSNKVRSSYKGRLMDFPASTIAEQITYFEYNIYSKIVPSELIDGAWHKSDKMKTSPKVSLMVERFNSVCYWVAHQICDCRDFKDRVNLVSTFIALANDLANLNNYNGLMEILGGLNNSSVQRLKRTWTVVLEKYEETWEALNELMDSKNNYVRYREHFQTASLPAIPFLGVFLRDLTFIEDGNPDFLMVQPRKINIEKYELLGSVFTDIQRYQSTSYPFVAHKDLQRYFAEEMIAVPEDADDLLYEASIQSEPPSTISSSNIRLSDKDKSSIAYKSMSL